MKPGETVVFEVKDWKFGDAAVEVENVKWMLNGEDKTADAAGGKLTATAGADGTKLELKVSANVKGEPAKKGEIPCTVNVSSGTTKPSGDGGSGGGCDAGFGALGLALAAASKIISSNFLSIKFKMIFMSALLINEMYRG